MIGRIDYYMTIYNLIMWMNNVKRTNKEPYVVPDEAEGAAASSAGCPAASTALCP
jgi:hypothetical protein